MGLSYLDGSSWAEVTREERVFCAHLFHLWQEKGTASFLEHVREVAGVSLPTEAEWEPAYEACFYRDLWHLRGRKGPLFSLKRTFDLCLLSEGAILIIEAKAQQQFDLEQLNSFAVDRDEVRKLTGVPTHLVGLASSACTVPRACDDVFEGPVLTWKGVASLYDDDPLLLRADAVYETETTRNWGRNNLGGYLTGEQLLAAFENGEELCVGRDRGLRGKPFAEDVQSGAWRSQPYETASGSEPPNRNWFRLAEFVDAVDPEPHTA